MRRLLWIVALFTLAWACKDDDKTIGPGPGDFYLDLSKESVLAWDTLTYVKIDVSTNGEFWDVQADSTAPWCEPSMNDTKTDRSITLRIAPNGNAGERQAEIKVNGEDDIVKIITVKQMGTAPTIIYHAGDLDKISDDSVRLIIDIEANMEYDIIIPEAYQSWLSWAGTEEGDRVRNYFTVNRNLGEPRDGMIILKGIQYPEIEEEIYLRQLAYNSEYTPVDPGDIGKSKDIKLKMVSATASSYQGGAEASKLIDGGLGTGWHSNWGGANTDLPITLELTLEENQNTLDYIMYYPRSPRGNGTPGLVDIDYTTADDPTNYKVFGKYDFGMLADTRKLTPPAPITAPAKIRLIVRSGVGGFGSINEVEAWQIAQPDPTILGIFTDNTYSALNPGVTYEMITQLPEPFLFNIAKYLLTGDYPVADRVREYLPYRHPDNVAKELKTSTYSLYDNPTGIYFRPMDDVVVFVGATNGEQVGIRIINPMNGGLQEETFSLQEGENKFTSRYGGLAYINYYTENSKAQPLKVHVASGFVNGLFDVTKHTKADWGGILDNATYAALDVVGERMHLLFEVEDWKTVSDPVELIRAWDDIVKLEEELMGLVKYDRVPKNRVFGHVDKSPTASWMYATAYRTGYSEPAIAADGMLDVNKIRTTGVWGPAHEIGHVNQVRPGMKWIGTTEVTNNIYSLYVQTQFGNVSRLTTSKTYEAAFSALMLPEIPHGAATDPFVKLVPFWQLQLYAQAAGKADAYYPDLFENLRRFADKTDNGERQLDYVKYSCQLLQLDLTDFFVDWGFLREVNLSIVDYATEPLKITAAQVNETKNTIVGYGYAPAPATLPYLTDNNVDFLKNRQAVVTGTASRSGQRITLTGWQNVMVYKTYYEGSVVYISADPSFNIPSDYPADSTEIKAVQWDGTEIAVTI